MLLSLPEVVVVVVLPGPRLRIGRWRGDCSPATETQEPRDPTGATPQIHQRKSGTEERKAKIVEQRAVKNKMGEILVTSATRTGRGGATADSEGVGAKKKRMAVAAQA